MDITSPTTQPSHSSRFAADWALRQSQLIASGSWLGNVSQHLPGYTQLQS